MEAVLLWAPTVNVIAPTVGIRQVINVVYRVIIRNARSVVHL